MGRKSLLHRRLDSAKSKSKNLIGLPMLHRHLNHQGFTLAAIDDLISRGRWDDWVELRRAALADQSVLDKVVRVCRAQVSDPYAQRHHFWLHYAEEHRPSA